MNDLIFTFSVTLLTPVSFTSRTIIHPTSNEDPMASPPSSNNINSVHIRHFQSKYIRKGINSKTTGCTHSTPLQKSSNPFGKYEDILTHHSVYDKSTAQRRENPSLETLGFVTPWNNRGYDIVISLNSPQD